MTTETKNIWIYAKSKVDNKGFFTRIGHSARFHSLRSALSSGGSAKSKLLKGLGAVGRASFSLIPIPIIGGLLASAESALENRVRSYFHTHRSGPQTLAEHVKFSLKEASVENLDRYRFKVEHAIKEMTDEGKKFASIDLESLTDQCNPNVNLAMKIAQAERRLEKFQQEVLSLKALMEASVAWSEGTSASIANYRKQVTDYFAAVAQAELDAVATGTPAEKEMALAELKLKHANCSDFCIYKKNIVGGTWADFRATAADVVRELQAPFSADNFLSANATSFESANQLNNYLPKSSRPN